MNTDHSSVAQLQDILVGTDNLDEFLSGLCGYAAGIIKQTTSEDIEVAVTLKRRRRVQTMTGTSLRHRAGQN
jgi:hypothetical protein